MAVRAVQHGMTQVTYSAWSDYVSEWGRDAMAVRAIQHCMTQVTYSALSDEVRERGSHNGSVCMNCAVPEAVL